ncbi:hypothetical protein E4T47_02435 [Aureobasidium subglaciale]|nr:hypothetical protein E4T43_02450 [Aureobasidium subglaciale]KAI5274560.1 hypothetical protein E4T47_02435 [Aureobasidium subglaciale]
MSVQPLNDLWEAAAGQPYEPTIGKDSQFTVGITLLFTDPSLKNLPLIGLPASLAAGYAPPSSQVVALANRASFGAVYMICAVGVYV